MCITVYIVRYTGLAYYSRSDIQSTVQGRIKLNKRRKCCIKSNHVIDSHMNQQVCVCYFTFLVAMLDSTLSAAIGRGIPGLRACTRKASGTRLELFLANYCPTSLPGNTTGRI